MLRTQRGAGASDLRMGVYSEGGVTAK